jgi:hypothetical protein
MLSLSTRLPVGGALTAAAAGAVTALLALTPLCIFVLDCDAIVSFPAVFLTLLRRLF